FFACIIFGNILIHDFLQFGSFFDKGGDDHRFYSHFLRASEGEEYFLNSRYGNYIYLGKYYISLLKIFGIKHITPILIYPLNWFIGANLCVLTYLLALRFNLNRSEAYRTTVLLSIYPFFLLHEVKILRDI